MPPLDPQLVETLLGRVRAKGPSAVKKSEARKLKSTHPDEFYKAWQAYEVSLRLPLSPPLLRPSGISAADWLISLKPEFGRSALAKWDGRHDCDTLNLLAELHSLCPEITSAPWAIWDRPGQRDPSLLDFVFAGATWAIEARHTPIDKLDDIDRQGSMVGGWPWTCEQFPWPVGQSGRMSPLFQLNLQGLDLTSIAEFPPILVQGWGDDTEFFTRTVPISAIVNTSPDKEFAGHEQEHLYYDGGQSKYKGETIETGEQFFQITGNDLYYCIENMIAYIEDTIDPGRLKIAANLVDQLMVDLKNWDLTKKSRFRRSHFGGYQNPVQFSYEPWKGNRSLFEIQSSDGRGLSIYFDGSMQVTFSIDNLANGYETNGSR